MKVLAVVTTLPSQERPDHARFTFEHLQLIQELVDLHVVHVKVSRGRALHDPVVRIADYPGLNEVTVVETNGLPLLAQRFAARQIARFPFDLVHSHSLDSVVFARSLARGAKSPWLHTEHSSEWTDPSVSGLMLRYTDSLKRSVGKADLVTAVSTYLADGMNVRLGTTPMITPNVVDVARFPIRETGGRLPSEVHVIAAASLVESKQPLLALEAFDIFREQRPGATLTWIGTGPMRAEFEAEISRRGLGEYVRLLPPLPHAEYLEVLAEHDVFLLPTQFETFCVTAAEALACGLPVVLGARGGQGDFVTPEVGVLVTDPSAAGYAAGLGRAAALVIHHAPEHFRAAVARFGPLEVQESFRAAYAVMAPEAMRE